MWSSTCQILSFFKDFDVLYADLSEGVAVVLFLVFPSFFLKINILTAVVFIGYVWDQTFIFIERKIHYKYNIADSIALWSLAVDNSK